MLFSIFELFGVGWTCLGYLYCLYKWFCGIIVFFSYYWALLVFTSEGWGVIMVR